MNSILKSLPKCKNLNGSPCTFTPANPSRLSRPTPAFAQHFSGSFSAFTAFTLVELMIVVLIVGILGSLATSGYGEYVKRAKVAEAQSNLSHLKVKAEQFFGDRRTYTDFCSTNSVTSISSSSKYFTLSCSSDDTSYTLSMTGTASQNMSGYFYQIDNNGTKTSKAGGSSFNCWVMLHFCVNTLSSIKLLIFP